MEAKFRILVYAVGIRVEISLYWAPVANVAETKRHQRLDEVWIIYPHLLLEISKLVFKKISVVQYPPMQSSLQSIPFVTCQRHAFHTSYDIRACYKRGFARRGKHLHAHDAATSLRFLLHSAVWRKTTKTLEVSIYFMERVAIFTACM